MTAEQAKEHYDELVVESIKRAQEKAKESKNFLFFKINVSQYKKLQSRLQSEVDGVTYAGVYRENLLDRCICMVRDCFSFASEFGKPVFAQNGTETDLCFGRRSHRELEVQANFTDVKGCIKKDNKKLRFMKKQQISLVSSETLFRFEDSLRDEDYQISIDAWMKFLKPMLQDSLERDLVASTLQDDRGARVAKSIQSKMYNYGEIKSKAWELKQGWGRFLHH